MSRRLKQAAVVVVVLAAAAQFARPDWTSPTSDPSCAIGADPGTTGALHAVLDRSCGDCHSNKTVSSSWYTNVAPLSWVMARSVTEGRKAVNFSDWTGYPASVQRTLLSASCDDAMSGKMPGPYTWFRPDVKLSPEDIETICGAARQR